MADAALEREQAEFDLVIAEKENEVKLHEAADKQRSLALKGQRDHDMAVLKAQQRAAMATAKISAIEQSLSEEKMYMRPEATTEMKNAYGSGLKTKNIISIQSRPVAERSTLAPIKHRRLVGLPILLQISNIHLTWTLVWV
jgi:hypothetical protein